MFRYSFVFCWVGEKVSQIVDKGSDEAGVVFIDEDIGVDSTSSETFEFLHVK